MRHIVAVLGYGPIVTPWMEEYILSVVEFLRGHESDVISFIVLSGGRTYASVPRSEAEMMEELLKKKSAECDLSLPPIIRDEESITTIQNLEALARIIRDSAEGEVPTVTIFCSRSHKSKVRSLAGRILDVQKEDISILDIPGFSVSVRQGRVNGIFQDWVARPIELIALRCSPLRRLLEARRRRIIAWR